MSLDTLMSVITGLSILLFNIYLKSLGEVICEHRVNYCWYAYDAQLFICILGKLGDAVKVLS